MSHPIDHAKNSVKTFGGKIEDYLPIHIWFDETKGWIGDSSHRVFRHHSEGIFWAEEKFGTYITNSDGKQVPVRFIGEQHVLEDIGFIPTIKDYLKEMTPANWMYVPGEGRKILKQIKEEKLDFIKGGKS